MHPVDERLKKTVEIQKTTMEIEEKGVKLRLTIVDTPGMKSYLLILASHRFGHVKY
jgi:septin family protein